MRILSIMLFCVQLLHGAFTHHQVVTTTGNVSQLPGSLSGFPAYLTITDVALKFGGGGFMGDSTARDACFFEDSGYTTPIPSKNLYYDGSLGTLKVRFKRLNLVLSSTFYLAYGDPGVSTCGQAVVWDSNYRTVLDWGHASLSLVNSTGGANATQGNAALATSVAGIVDDAMQCANGTNQWIDAGNLPSNSATAITVSFWVNPAAFAGSYNAMVGKNDGGSSSFVVHIKSTGKLAVYLQSSGGGANYDGTGSALSAGTWYHVAATYDSTNGLKGYINGVVDGSAAAAGTLSTGSVTSLRICRNWNDTTFAPGKYDEVRASDIARSPNWIKTEYQNELSPSTFFMFGGDIVDGAGSTRVPHRTIGASRQPMQPMIPQVDWGWWKLPAPIHWLVGAN